MLIFYSFLVSVLPYHYMVQIWLWFMQMKPFMPKISAGSIG